MMHYEIDILDDYLHGELDATRDAAVHAHLEACATCRAAYHEAATARDWLRAAASAEERELPAQVRARVWDAVNAPAPVAPVTWLRSRWRPLAALPVAAAVALAAYLGFPVAHASARVAASDLLIEHAAGMAGNPLADHGVVVPASTANASVPSSTIVEAVDLTSDDTGAGQ